MSSKTTTVVIPGLQRAKTRPGETSIECINTMFMTTLIVIINQLLQLLMVFLLSNGIGGIAMRYKADYRR